MARNLLLRRERDRLIVHEYNQWSAKGFRHDFIVTEKLKHWLLMPRTIEAILRGEYDKKIQVQSNQLALPLD